jgi:pimeloyl-ACP methyl ester carboxylesterase
MDVQTAEGTPLAVWMEGDGPAIVLVHGSMCDHTAFDPLSGELRRDFTVFALDRRGFGASPDSGGYDAEREFGDVAAVVEAVGRRTGERVTLFGHSWGASCALGGAARSRGVGRLVLYEPSLGLRYPPGFIDRVQAQVAAGDAEGAIVSVLVDLAGMTGEQVADMRASPTWPVPCYRPHYREGSDYRE